MICDEELCCSAGVFGAFFSITSFAWLLALETKSKGNMEENSQREKIVNKNAIKGVDTKEHALLFSFTIIIFNNVLLQLPIFYPDTEPEYVLFISERSQKMLISVNYAECSYMDFFHFPCPAKK